MTDPYAPESPRQARIREHQEALDDEWNRPIDLARKWIETTRETVATILRYVPKKDRDAVLGHLDNAIADLPTRRGE